MEDTLQWMFIIALLVFESWNANTFMLAYKRSFNWKDKRNHQEKSSEVTTYCTKVGANFIVFICTSINTCTSVVHLITAQVSLSNAFLKFQSLHNTKFGEKKSLQNKIISTAYIYKWSVYTGTKTIPKVNTCSVLDQSCRSNFTTFSDAKHFQTLNINLWNVESNTN